MKMTIKCILAVAVLVGVAARGQTGKDDNVDLLVGGGFIVSPGYSDFIDDAYKSPNSTSDGEGWLDLYVGVEIRPAKQFGVLLGCDMLINGVDVSGGGPLDENYANIIMVPSVYGQLYFTETRTFYINGGVTLPLPDTGSDKFEFKNNGLGLGANVGVEIADLLRIEGGYSYIPVTVKGDGSSFKKDYDFGGLQIRVLLAF